MIKVSRKLFEQECSKSVRPLFINLGFSESEPGVYVRLVDRVMHGFGFTLSRSAPQFYVPVGVSAPCVTPKIEYVTGVRQPSLTLCKRLGEFPTQPRNASTYYAIDSNDEIPTVLRTACSDLLDHGIPWLDEISTLEVFAERFYEHRLAPLSDGTKRQPNAFYSAMYGWILEELGESSEAQLWLQEAREALSANSYTSNGRILKEHEPGAVPLEPSAEERRLMELLEH